MDRGQSPLVDIMCIEPLDDDLLEGRSPPTDRPRVFGGLVLAQALLAAGGTVPVEHGVHALHASFLQPGDPEAPIRYRVTRSRDGRSFTTRQVLAEQSSRPILHLTASFHRSEDGDEHAFGPPDVVEPEQLSVLPIERMHDPVAAAIARRSGIDLRYAPIGASTCDGPRPTGQRVWFRVTGSLGDDHLLHAAALTYASDLTVLVAALVPHDLRAEDRQMASLNHAMWFHRPVRADGWLLFDLRAERTTGARGLATGRLHTTGTHHVATVAQEGLVRPPRHRRGVENASAAIDAGRSTDA